MKQVDELQGEAGSVGPTPAAFRAPAGGHAGARPLRLPPNTSLEKFNDYMERIQEIVGTENATVVSSDAELQLEDYLEPSKAHDVRGRPAACIDSTDDTVDVLHCRKGILHQQCSRCAPQCRRSPSHHETMQ